MCIVLVIAITAAVGEVKFSLGYDDFKVAFIRQVEIEIRLIACMGPDHRRKLWAKDKNVRNLS